MRKILLFMGLVLSFPSLALAANAQVSMNARHRSVVEIFRQMEEQSGMRFMYHVADIERLGSRDLDVKGVSLGEALDIVLRGSNVGYEIVGNTVVFKRVEAQQPRVLRTVVGVVVDDAGNAMSGASVMLRGTNTGTTTDRNGRFSLRIPSTDNVVLDVDFLGYVKRSVNVGAGESELHVVMRESVTKVDEVIVTGYGSIDKSSYVGAQTTVVAKDILKAGESSIDQMLQGVVPGMSVVNTTGKVGGTPKIRIRGTSTIMGNQEPLWVVDGVIQRDPLPLPDESSPLYSEMEGLMETAGNAISWLNPNDIETITVLKDASATAIYGSQAGNGVIVITTKKATGEGLSASYSGSYTVGQRPRYSHYDLMNSQQQMLFQQQMWQDRDVYNTEVLPIGFGKINQQLQNKEITYAEYEREFHKLEQNNTDWFDILFRNSFSQQHNVSVSGVGNRVNSRFSVGLNRQNGGAKHGDELKGLTANSNTTFRIDDRLIVTLSLNGAFRENSDFAFGVSPYDYAMNTSRTLPLYNDDGSLHYYVKRGKLSSSIPSKQLYNYNILNEIANTGARNTTTTLGATLNVQAKIAEGLNFRGMVSYQVASSRQKSWATELSNHISSIRGYEFGEVVPGSAAQKASILPFGGVLIRRNAMNNDYMIRGSFDYSRTFNDVHRLMVQLGAEASSLLTNSDADTRYGYLYYRGESFASVPTTALELAGAATPDPLELHENMRKAASVINTVDNKVSQYLTAVYNFDDRYVMNFNARLDASNRFGQDNNKKFNPAWSMGVKWRAGNEPWMEWAQNVIYNFDVSASYGWRGNAVQAVSPYMIATDGGFDSNFEAYTLNLKSLPYPNLGWEKMKDWNIGFDVSFLEGRLAAEINYYDKKSHVLSSREVPIENGVTTAYVTGTTMGNHGYDLVVSATPVRTKNVTWSLRFNAGKYKNTMKNNQRENTEADYLNGTAIVEGKAYKSFWAWNYAGLDPETGRALFYGVSKDRLEAPTQNMLDYLVLAGCLEPDFSGGLSTTVRYKDLTLSADFAVSFGAQSFLSPLYTGNDKTGFGAPTPDRNVPMYLFDRWRKPGDEAWTDIPAIPYAGTNTDTVLPDGETIDKGTIRNSYTLYNQSTHMLADTDFIRCRSIALRYNLPASILGKVGARNASVSASMTNPFLIAFDKKWEGRDPESAQWPARRTMSFSLNLTF